MRPIKTIEERATRFSYLSSKRLNGFFLRYRCLPVSATFGISDQSLFQFLRDAQVIHHEAPGLVLKDSIHAWAMACIRP